MSFAEAAGGVDYDKGNVSMVLDASTLVGTDGATARSFDNITVGKNGEVLIRDEESSGIIEVTDAIGRNDGQRCFLGVMQARCGIAGELVEGGQMYLITQVAEPETCALMLSGLAFVGFVARRRRQTAA